MNAEYDKKTTRQKYMKNDQYYSFKETIYVRLGRFGATVVIPTCGRRKSSIPEALCRP